MSGIGSNNGWLEAAIAWEVCASLHRQYCKGKDGLFNTRQSDFVKHAENARRLASRGQTPSRYGSPELQAPILGKACAVDADVRLERERLCAAIKAEDDYCVEHGDYMLDSDDCIKIVRGEWQRPDFAIAALAAQGGKDA